MSKELTFFAHFCARHVRSALYALLYLILLTSLNGRCQHYFILQIRKWAQEISNRFPKSYGWLVAKSGFIPR